MTVATLSYLMLYNHHMYLLQHLIPKLKWQWYHLTLVPVCMADNFGKLTLDTSFNPLFCLSPCVQNHIYEWSRDHRVHHKHSETNADPHNAKRGFFFSHVGWVMVRKHPCVIEKGQKIDLSDLKADKVVMFQKRWANTSHEFVFEIRLLSLFKWLINCSHLRLFTVCIYCMYLLYVLCIAFLSHWKCVEGLSQSNVAICHFDWLSVSRGWVLCNVSWH